MKFLQQKCGYNSGDLRTGSVFWWGERMRIAILWIVFFTMQLLNVDAIWNSASQKHREVHLPMKIQALYFNLTFTIYFIYRVLYRLL